MATTVANQDLAALKRHLEAMIRQFKELTKLFLQEREAVKQRKLQELETSSRLVAVALEGLQDSDNLRQALTHTVATLAGITRSDISLADLDQALGGNSGLLPLRDQLKSAILEADKRNQENRAILEGVQQATQALLSIYKQSAQGGESYNRLGGRRTGPALNLYSRKL